MGSVFRQVTRGGRRPRPPIYKIVTRVAVATVVLEVRSTSTISHRKAACDATPSPSSQLLGANATLRRSAFDRIHARKQRQVARALSSSQKGTLHNEPHAAVVAGEGMGERVENRELCEIIHKFMRVPFAAMPKSRLREQLSGVWSRSRVLTALPCWPRWVFSATPPIRAPVRSPVRPSAQPARPARVSRGTLTSGAGEHVAVGLLWP